MLIDYDNTLKLIYEDVNNIDTLITNNLGRVKAANDQQSISNKFKPRPLGIIISDSYNNPFFLSVHCPGRTLPRLIYY